MKTNLAQRKFLKELADLMQKHNASIQTNFDHFELEGYSFNVGGKQTETIRTALKPSDLRNICNNSN